MPLLPQALDATAAAPTVGSIGARTAAGALLVMLGAAFLTVTMLAASMVPGYDFNGGAISDLGVIDQTAMLFNGLLVAVGALNIAAGYLLYRWHQRNRILGLYVLAGMGAAGAGFLPLDMGAAHSLFALLGFVFFNLETLATATVLRGPMRALSLVAGWVGLLYVVVMVIGDSGNQAIFGAIGHGGAERMIVFPAMLWTVAFGGNLMAGGSLRLGAVDEQVGG